MLRASSRDGQRYTAYCVNDTTGHAAISGWCQTDNDSMTDDATDASWRHGVVSPTSSHHRSLLGLMSLAAHSPGVTLKCFHEKSAQGEIITDLINVSLLKYCRPHKKSLQYRLAPRKVSPSGRQSTCKYPSRPGGCPAGRIFAGKLSAGGDFSEGDPTMGHRHTLTVTVTAVTVSDELHCHPCQIRLDTTVYWWLYYLSTAAPRPHSTVESGNLADRKRFFTLKRSA